MVNEDKNSVGIVETRTIRVIEPANPLPLVSGKTLAPIDVAYETYGTLSKSGDNTILICHALSGNAHVAGYNSPKDEKPGWWDIMVGPGKAIDTNKYFVVCSNFLGGCSGTTGPCSINPSTAKPYGLTFPIITITDMVRVQKLWLEKIGVKNVLAVIGGSMGGMQVLQWAIDYPDFVKSAIVIAASPRLSTQSIAFDAVGRNAILADPNFAGGQYHDQDAPDRGLAIARMIGHITYLSEHTMHKKFGRTLRASENYKYDFNSEFAVETYLDYQGQRFVERFDANSYLYITKAMDYFDLKKDYGSLTGAFEKAISRFLIVSFTSDWLFPPAQSKELVDALLANGKDVSYCNINTPYGHDAFLLEPDTLGNLINDFIHATRHPQEALAAQACLADRDRTKKVTMPGRARVDYALIESLIKPNTSVLDTGCGDGELLANLMLDKNITAKGIELDEKLVLACVKRGIPIIQHDIELGLANCSDKSFDYVILSQTVQTVKDPEKVFSEVLRIGKKVIVSFPNFAYWKARCQLLLSGKAPITGELPFHWYNSPNIHFLSLKDFDSFCEKLGVTIEKRIPLHKNRLSPVKLAANFFAEQAVYVTSRP